MANMEKQLADLLNRLETVTKRLESVEGKVASGGASSAPAGPPSAAVDEYQSLIDQFITPFLSHAKNLGDATVVEQAELLVKAVNAQKDFLTIASQSKKPNDATLQELVKPTSDLMGQITALKDKNRSSKFFNNLSTIAEGIGALGWVVVSPTPGPMVGEMRGSAEFYGNRILKEFKGKDNNQTEYVTCYVNFLKELQNYIKKYHTTGTTWNPQGGDAKPGATSTSTSSSSTPSTSAPKPAAPAPAKGPNPADLFSALNKGGEITSGLKKVADDQKTHKNPNLRAGSVVPAKEGAKEAAPKAAASNKWSGTPKVELQGNKWVVEYQIGNSNVVIEETEMKQTVYVYRCKNSTIQIKGKVNSISLDDCEKVGIVFENVLGNVEAVNCKSIQIQAIGKCPIISIDKTQGGQIFLSRHCLDVEIITSTSSELNVSIPQDSDELTETPVPEQFRSFIKGGKLHTEHVVHKA